MSLGEAFNYKGKAAVNIDKGDDAENMDEEEGDVAEIMDKEAYEVIVSDVDSGEVVLLGEVELSDNEEEITES